MEAPETLNLDKHSQGKAAEHLRQFIRGVGSSIDVQSGQSLDDMYFNVTHINNNVYEIKIRKDIGEPTEKSNTFKVSGTVEASDIEKGIRRLFLEEEQIEAGNHKVLFRSGIRFEACCLECGSRVFVPQRIWQSRAERTQCRLKKYVMGQFFLHGSCDFSNFEDFWDTRPDDRKV